ncbi:LysR family transcriptional regulator [Aliihoeflea aestuarii]|uniref:LysR family transcriptional regulator n=1 Tax=Aliihoeflea aestuarii TaxID=453840 RepID=UPI0020922702|nr:LysR family transcriptional regulator [Aliihoeflea aestuarii]MCO6390104.1 LysR family transcriptional regulator [Aliihoeflea aestuarii]
MRINFDFADLEAFLVLIETRSFIAAARHLGTSQSALTRRIRKLEKSIDTELFERTTRSVRPTLAAKRLRARAQAMVGDARETMREMRDDTALFAFQNRTIVTIAAVPSAIARIVMPALGLFSTSSGGSRVRILDLLANDVVEAVGNGTADFGISSLPILEEQVVFEPLVEDRVVLAMPRGHPLAREESVKWDALSSHRLILPVQGSGNRALIDQALARSQSTPFWTYEVPRTSTALELVRAGLGIAPVPLCAIPMNEDLDLVKCELTNPDISRTIGLVTIKGATLTAAAKLLRDIIVDR